MDKYLPYHADLDDGTKWVYGWHLERPIEYNDWDNDQVQGAMTSTEGYYPLKEDEEERKFAELTNANEHNASSALERAKAAAEAAAESAKLAADAGAAADGEAKKEDGKEVPAEGAKEGAKEGEKKEEKKAALMQQSTPEISDGDDYAYSNAAKFNTLAQGKIITDQGAEDIDSSQFDEDKEIGEW